MDPCDDYKDCSFCEERQSREDLEYEIYCMDQNMTRMRRLINVLLHDLYNHHWFPGIYPKDYEKALLLELDELVGTGDIYSADDWHKHFMNSILAEHLD